MELRLRGFGGERRCRIRTAPNERGCRADWKRVTMKLGVAVMIGLVVSGAVTAEELIRARRPVDAGKQTGRSAVNSQEDATRDVESAAGIDLLAAQLTTLTARVQTLEAELRALRETSTSCEKCDGAEDSSTIAAALPPPSREDYVARLESFFDAERHDPNWASRHTSSIQSVIQDEPTLRSAFRSLDCRSRHCRLELQDDGDQELSRALMLFTARIGTSLPMAEYTQVDGANGEHWQVIYLSEQNEETLSARSRDERH
jgi:hypothetical protein